MERDDEEHFLQLQTSQKYFANKLQQFWKERIIREIEENDEEQNKYRVTSTDLNFPFSLCEY